MKQEFEQVVKIIVKKGHIIERPLNFDSNILLYNKTETSVMLKKGEKASKEDMLIRKQRDVWKRSCQLGIGM